MIHLPIRDRIMEKLTQYTQNWKVKIILIMIVAKAKIPAILMVVVKDG